MSAAKDTAIRAAWVPDAASRIRAALERALRNDLAGKYSLPDGLPALREAVAETHARAAGVRVFAPDNVFDRLEQYFPD
jgi:aspartate/methionine/tyrosine aminotransferase